jgi:hypothetical protein
MLIFSRRWMMAHCFAMLVMASPRAWSIEIEVAPKNRVGGYVVREDAGTVTIRVISPDGKDKVTTYDRAKIKIVHQVSRDRLEKLSQTKPKDYRDYADELAVRTNDPEAKETALRLYLIAGYLSPNDLGSYCLGKMSQIAPSAADSRRFKAMAVLLDPKGDPAILKAEPAKKSPAAGPEAKLQAAALLSFQTAMRSIRSGALNEAREAARKDGVEKIFAAAPAVGDQKAFLQICTDSICPTCRLKKNVRCTKCNGKGKAINMFGVAEICTMCNGKGEHRCTACDGSGMSALSDDQLRAVLQAELWSIECAAAGEVRPAGSVGERNWSSVLKAPPRPAVVLSLETISEYDPRLCVYRKGAWTMP